MKIRKTSRNSWESDDGLTFRLIFSHQSPSKNFSGSFKFDSKSAQMLPHEDRFDLIISDGRKIRDLPEDGAEDALRNLGYEITR